MAEEKRLDNKVLDYIESIGGYCVKNWGGGKYGKKGLPDIFACINGEFYGIEDKSRTGRPSMLQIKNLEWIRSAGGYGILLYPKDFDNFIRFVECQSSELQWYLKNIELQEKWKERLDKVH